MLLLILTPQIVSAEDAYDDLQTFCKSCTVEIQIDQEIEEKLKQTPSVISLDEAIAVALENNFNIKVADDTFVSSKYTYKQALAQFLPNVQFYGYAISYNGQILVGTALNEFINEIALSGALQVTYDFTDSGRQIFDARAKKFKARAGLKNLDFTKNEIIARTGIAYYQLLKSKLGIEIQLKNLYERTAQLKLTQTLMEAGLGTKFDVIRSESERATAEQDLMIVLNTFRLNQAKLANVMGIEINTTLYPIEVEAKPFILTDEQLTVDDMFKIAELSRDDVKALQSQIRAMREEKKSIYADYIPNLSGMYQAAYQGTEQTDFGTNQVVSAYLTIPLGKRLGVDTTFNARGKQAQIDAANFTLIQKKRDIKENILQSSFNSKILKRRIDIAKEQVSYATDSVSLAEMRLDAGEGILIDVIQAQTLKTKARIELLNTVIDYNVNQIQLLFDQGIITYDNVTKNYNP